MIDELNCVTKAEQREAIAYLKKRMSNGEDAGKILRLKDTYYISKIVDRLCPLTRTLYERILQQR